MNSIYTQHNRLSTASLQAQNGESHTAHSINRAKDIIARHFAADIEMETVARQVGLNYSSFRKLFKKIVGISPLAFVEELRISRSKELLTHTDRTSQQVAYAVGFNTPYYFCLFFKKRTGMSPLEYRRHSRNAGKILVVS